MKPEELDWCQKNTGEPKRDYLWWDKREEDYTAEDVFWELYYNNGGGPGDGVGVLSFEFEGLLYRVYVYGPACAFRPTPENPESELLESHEWNTWGELLETIRWKNRKTLSRMLRTLPVSALEYEEYDEGNIPLRYTPKDAQALPENAPPANTPES